VKEIGNDWAYFFDSKRFALWHRRSLPMSAKAIDIDLNAYCVRCYRPIYVVEATSSSGDKPSRVLQAAAEAAQCRAFLAYVEPSTAPPDEFPWKVCADAAKEFVVEKMRLVQVWPSRVDLGWVSSETAAKVLLSIRSEHESECVQSRLGAVVDQ